MSRALKKYLEFHQQAPRKEGDFHPDLRIPAFAVCIGRGKDVLYRSDKLNPTTLEDEGWIDYIHDHKAGVRVYVPEGLGDGNLRTVPSWLQRTEEFVRLGHCLGFSYYDYDGKSVEAKGTDPLPELYTTPSGKALLVIQSKRRLLAMIWGGRLGVEARGIIN